MTKKVHIKPSIRFLTLIPHIVPTDTMFFPRSTITFFSSSFAAINYFVPPFFEFFSSFSRSKAISSNLVRSYSSIFSIMDASYPESVA